MFVVVAEIKTLAITQSLLFWTWMGCCRYAYAAYTCLILITWRLAHLFVCSVWYAYAAYTCLILTTWRLAHLFVCSVWYAHAAYTCLILITWRFADIGVNCLATLCRFTAIRGIVIAVIEASLTLAVGILTEHVGAAGRVALSAMFIVSGEIRA